MAIIIAGIEKAFRLLLAGDPEILRITWLTFRVSGTATLLSVLVGIPSGVYLALAATGPRRLLMSLVNTGMGLPPTVVGLWVSIMLWRSGPFGALGLIYTPTAMIIAQAIIAAPIVAGLTASAIGQINPKLRLQLLSLGASRGQFLWLIVREARLPLLAAVMAGFGRVVAEVGASMMVGGNVKGYTRVLTTATVMEVSKGSFDVAIATSTILVGLAYLVTLALTMVQQKGN